MKKLYFTLLIWVLPLSEAYSCNEIDMSFQRKAIMTAMLENPNYDQLRSLKETLQKVSLSCDDPLDTLELSLKISEVQILLGTELIEAENLLLELKDILLPVKDYYPGEYNQLLGQLLALYIRAGRSQLAKFYAKKVLYDQNLDDNELRADAFATTNPKKYNPTEDQIKLANSIGKENSLFRTSVLVPYHASFRYLNHLQRLLNHGKIEDIKKQASQFRAGFYLNKNTTFVSDNLISISLTEEVASLKSSAKEYKPSKELVIYNNNKRHNISLENRLIIDLLITFDDSSNMSISLKNAVSTFRLILSAYDFGRQIRMKPQINAILASLLDVFPEDSRVKSTVFQISQHLFATNPVAPTLKLESDDLVTYRQLVSRQQQLLTRIKEAKEDNEYLIMDIARLARNLQISSRRSTKSMSEVQSNLSKTESLLYAVDLGSRSAIFHITKSSSDIIVIDSKKLYQDIIEHRQRIISRQDARASGAHLNETLKINYIKSDRLLLVAFGTLELLPASTLYNLKSKKWLIEEKAISRLSLLDRIEEVNNSDVKIDNILAVSDPIFYLPPPEDFELSPNFESHRAVINLASLPDTYFESIDLIGKNKPQSRVLLSQEDAVESTVKNSINNGGWNLISFSTHTIFPSSKVSIPYPGLALSIDYKDTINDSILQADEIANLNINGSSIILAACNTANSSEVGGSFNSLITSFQFAGASNIIASQWNVYSEETSEFMSQVGKLVNSGKYNPESAIREVQKISAIELGNQSDSASVWGAWEIYQ